MVLGRTKIYFKVACSLPVAYMEAYRLMYEELYGDQAGLTDREILRQGFRHAGLAVLFQPSYFDFDAHVGEEAEYSLMLTAEEWKNFFGEEQTPFSSKEELSKSFRHYFEDSYNGMVRILDAEEKGYWDYYDSLLEDVDEDTAFQLLIGLKQMLLHDGCVLLERSICSFTYQDHEQKKWKIVYDPDRICVRRYRKFQ